ncbi:hypothetical protein ABFS82_04G029200 [Erythranthe guttata]
MVYILYFFFIFFYNCTFYSRLRCFPPKTKKKNRELVMVLLFTGKWKIRAHSSSVYFNPEVEGQRASLHGHVTAVTEGLEHGRHQLFKKLMKMASAQCYVILA